MGFLSDKKILITGLLSNRSIAYGIAKAMHREGAALAFTYQGEGVKDRVVGLAAEFGSDLIFPCDVAQRRADRRAVRANCGNAGTALDGIVHSDRLRPARSPVRRLPGQHHAAKHSASPTTSAVTASPRLAKRGLPLMQGRNAALLTLSYLGAERSMPNYNVMGLAKASLEANVRYMALQPGPEGHPRQRDLRRADQDAGRRRHRQFRQDSRLQRENTRRCGATSPPRRWATRRRSCAAIWPAASPARSLYVDAGFNTVAFAIVEYASQR